MDFSTSDNNLFSKKNIVSLLILLILILVIPLAVKLVQTQTQLKSKAAGDAKIEFQGDGVNCATNGTCTTTNQTIDLKLTSPYGPALGVTQTQ